MLSKLRITHEQIKTSIVVLMLVLVINDYVSYKKAKQHYSIAVEFDNNHQEEIAVEYYSEAIALRPRYIKVYVDRCGALNALERYDEALADCDFALKLAPVSVRGYANRCITYIGIGELERAFEDCIWAFNLAPYDGFVLNSMGRISSSKGELDQAIVYYTQSLERKPHYSATYYNRGRVYQRLGEYELALEDFQQACSMNANFFTACKTVVYTNIEFGDTEGALHAANQLVAKFPDRAASYYTRGWVYDFIYDTDSAISDYMRTIEIDPAFINAYWGLGNVYFDLNDADTALDFYCQYHDIANELDKFVLDQIVLLGGCPAATD